MFFSSNKSKSLYLKLGFSFFILIFITTILQTSYTYFSTKKELYSEIENNINVRALLAAEGAVFTDEGKVDMAVCGWDAAEIEAELFF